ncbi:hypothetical protein CEK26_002832 [Fusarium fujikuroi]|nr:hypothetical protein CEK27_002827 [Fusarium fujikuroi]QGI87853.1 hypothetical protein CEK25_002809 [Fusarium fujikuroi]QGJ01388.1 hypothetical protein CEK26_002832 [Fusarium fujikuroi]
MRALLDIIYKRSIKGKINKDLLKELLYLITSIRYIAIYRLYTNSAGLERFLTNTKWLTGILGDTIYIKAILQLHSDT